MFAGQLWTNYSYKIKSNLSLYSLYYVEAGKELTGPISASLRLLSNTAPFQEESHRWLAFGNTVSDSTGSKLEP